MSDNDDWHRKAPWWLPLARPFMWVLERLVDLIAKHKDPSEFADLASIAAVQTQERRGIGSRSATYSLELSHRYLEKAGRTDEALIVERNVWKRKQKALGPTHPDRSNSELGVAILLAKAKRNEEAEVHLRHIVDTEPTDRDESTRCTALAWLKSVLIKQGRWPEALFVLRKAVTAYQQFYGEDHERTLSMQQDLALALTTLNHAKAAVEIQRYVLAESIRTRGEDHDYTVSARERLATVLLSLGRLNGNKVYLMEAKMLNAEVLKALSGRRKTDKQRLDIVLERAREIDAALNR